MLAGTRFEVVASRLFQASTESRPSIGGIAAPLPVATTTARSAISVVVADDDPALAVEPALAAEELDPAFLQPRQLARVVEVVDHLVAAGEDRLAGRARRSPPRATPGTRRASASSSPGRSSAFEGMQA